MELRLVIPDFDAREGESFFGTREFEVLRAVRDGFADSGIAAYIQRVDHGIPTTLVETEAGEWKGESEVEGTMSLALRVMRAYHQDPDDAEGQG